MTFQEQLTSDLDVFFNTDEFAETVSYDGSDVSAVVNYGEAPKQDGKGQRDVCVIEVQKSDVAAPAYQDPVVIGSDTWYVKRKLRSDANVWVLELVTDKRPVFK